MKLPLEILKKINMYNFIFYIIVVVMAFLSFIQANYSFNNETIKMHNTLNLQEPFIDSLF